MMTVPPEFGQPREPVTASARDSDWWYVRVMMYMEYTQQGRTSKRNHHTESASTFEVNFGAQLTAAELLNNERPAICDPHNNGDQRCRNASHLTQVTNQDLNPSEL